MQPDSEQVERMIGQLMAGIKEWGEFNPPEGLSAAFTFAYRFSRTVLELSPGKEARSHNKEVIVSSLRRIAALIEFEEQQTANQKVH